MTQQRYDGPIIDAHHHLWDLAMGRHPWLAGGSPLGTPEFTRRSFLVPDLLAAAQGQQVVGTVHIEALWDRRRDAVEETLWVDGLARPGGIVGRIIGYVPLAQDNAAALLERQLAASPRVAGLRETIRWHPDPARRWAEPGIADDVAWRRGVAMLARHGLLLELLMNAHQAGEVARLAHDFPEQTFIVNHCCSPGERDPDSRRFWRDGLRAMAVQPNIAIKISHASAFAASTSVADLGEIILPCLEAFGPNRTMFGTDYPVMLRTTTYAAACDAMRDVLAPASAADQRAIFHDTAARIYGFVGM
jgi:predicted TIM-barrel fold metal-dependent hydrolase